MTDPISQAIVDGVPVSKAAARGFANERGIQIMTSAAEVLSRDLTPLVVIWLRATRAFYRRDASDTTSVADGATVLMDAAGNRWHRFDGERYDLVFAATGLLGPGEGLTPVPLTLALVLPAGLPGSRAYAVDQAPENAAELPFCFKASPEAVSWTELFRAVIAPGERQATFTLEEDIALPAGGILRAFAPDPHDAALETFAAAIAARR